MKDIAIYGAGGLGRETAVMINQINADNAQWNMIGFIDDGLPMGTRIDGIEILGGIGELNAFPARLSVALAIANPDTRHHIYTQIRNTNVDFPTLIHPTANLGDSSRNRWGVGCLITAGVIMTTGVRLGDFVIVNLSSTVGHDATLESFTSVMPGSSISGSVKIGSKTSIGTRSCILPGIELGEGCIVGAGAVVTKSFQAKAKIVGVPAKNLSA